MVRATELATRALVDKGPTGAPRKIRRVGFTLVESLLAVTLASIAGSALLLGVSSALQATQLSVEETVGLQLGQQLMDEIAGQRYSAVGASPYVYPIVRNASGSGVIRTNFTCLADYNGYRAQPPVDLYGVQIGRGDGNGSSRIAALQLPDYFNSWRTEVDVYYVSATDFVSPLAAGQTSDFRAVDVRVYLVDPLHGPRFTASLHRIFSNVPTP